MTSLASESLILATTPLTSHRDPIPADRVRAIVEAGADAGFAGVSIWTAHCDFAIADGMTAEEYYDYHRERGLLVPSSEVLIEWSGRDRRTIEEANAHILDVSARAGASRVIAASIDPEPVPIVQGAASLAILCDLAAERGLAISLEFMPFGGVLTLAQALQLVETADRENLGLVLDCWHWFHQAGGPDLATLRNVPPERVHLLQLNDAPAGQGPDLIAKSMHRLLPGEGDVDIFELMDVLGEIGATPVVVTEVFSLELAALEPAENARRQFTAAHALLARYRERVRA
jgi:sugar phosphate isomerase/epimerase